MTLYFKCRLINSLKKPDYWAGQEEDNCIEWISMVTYLVSACPAFV